MSTDTGNSQAPACEADQSAPCLPSRQINDSTSITSYIERVDELGVVVLWVQDLSYGPEFEVLCIRDRDDTYFIRLYKFHEPSMPRHRGTTLEAAWNCFIEDCTWDLIILEENTQDTLAIAAALKVTPHVQLVNDLGVAVLQTRVLIPVLGRSTANIRKVLCTKEPDDTYCMSWHKSDESDVIPGEFVPPSPAHYRGATLEAAWEGMLEADGNVVVIVGENRAESLELAGATHAMWRQHQRRVHSRSQWSRCLTESLFEGRLMRLFEEERADF